MPAVGKPKWENSHPVLVSSRIHSPLRCPGGSPTVLTIEMHVCPPFRDYYLPFVHIQIIPLMWFTSGKFESVVGNLFLRTRSLHSAFPTCTIPSLSQNH